MSLRFSLLGLVAFITFAGLASAALVRPSVEWLSVVVTLTVAMIVLQMLRVALLQDERRASAIGWLLFAVVYLALAIGPWLSEHVGPQLLSSRGLGYAQVHWRKDATEAYSTDYLQQVNLAQLRGIMLSDVNSNSPVPTASYSVAGWTYPLTSLNGSVTMPLTPAICFRGSGHWLCAWLAGWLGAAIAVQLQRRRAAAQTPQAA